MNIRYLKLVYKSDINSRAKLIIIFINAFFYSYFIYKLFVHYSAAFLIICTLYSIFIIWLVIRISLNIKSLSEYGDRIDKISKLNYDFDVYFNGDLHKNKHISKKTIGKIELPTGKIVAFDPLAYDNNATTSFILSVEPGTYDVEVILSDYIEGRKTIALSKIKFNDKPVSKWIMATTPNDNIFDVEDGQILGYPVDSGTGGFIDLSYLENWDAINDNYDNSEKILSKLDSKFLKNPWYFYSSNKIKTNLLIMETGSDGGFGSYWGISKNNEICSIVTEFDDIESLI